MSPENARTYFDPSTVITSTSKKSLSMIFKMPAVRKRFAALLKEQSNPAFLHSAARPEDALSA